MRKPIACVRQQERDTSILQFDEDADEQSGAEYYMRGGICWPVPVPGTLRSEGALIVCGVHCTTRRLSVFEVRTFAAIDTVVDTVTMRIAHRGIAGELARIMTDYGLRKIYYNQPDALHFPRCAELSRSPMLPKPPSFSRIEWATEADAVTHLLVAVEAASAEPNTPLHQQIITFRGRAGAASLIEFPAVYALTCAALGLARWPWKRADRPFYPPFHG